VRQGDDQEKEGLKERGGGGAQRWHRDNKSKKVVNDGVEELVTAGCRGEQQTLRRADRGLHVMARQGRAATDFNL
jgi:hypothetical protein